MLSNLCAISRLLAGQILRSRQHGSIPHAPRSRLTRRRLPPQRQRTFPPPPGIYGLGVTLPVPKPRLLHTHPHRAAVGAFITPAASNGAHTFTLQQRRRISPVRFTTLHTLRYTEMISSSMGNGAHCHHTATRTTLPHTRARTRAPTHYTPAGSRLLLRSSTCMYAAPLPVACGSGALVHCTRRNVFVELPCGKILRVRGGGFNSCLLASSISLS